MSSASTSDVPNQMAQLPEELMLVICMSLRPVDRDSKARKLKTRSLLSLCQTSKTWYRVARPQLYHTLDFENRGIDQLRTIVRTLLDHPQLRDAVYELRLRPGKNRNARGTGHGAVAVRTHSALHVPWNDLNLGISDQDMFRLQAGIRSRSEDSELALLFYLCHKIEILSFCLLYRVQEPMVCTAFRHASFDRPLAMSRNGSIIQKPLQYLHDVWVTCRGSYERIELDEIAPILQLPSLVTLKAPVLCLHGAHTPSITVTPTLKHLFLDKSCADALGLDWVLSQCPLLETLRLRWGDDLICGCPFRYTELVASAARGGRNLKHFTLEAPEVGEIAFEPAGLQSLPDLTFISLPAGGSFGAEMGEDDKYRLLNALPATVKTLELTGSEESLCDHTDYDEVILAILTSERFGRLTTVYIPRDDPFSRDLSGTQWRDCSTDELRLLLKRDCRD